VVGAEGGVLDRDEVIPRLRSFLYGYVVKPAVNAVR
jgi:hypothetical protein